MKRQIKRNNLLLYVWFSLVVSVAHLCFSGPISKDMEQNLLRSIYWAEGGPKAKVPFGVLSVKVKTSGEAQKVCLNTIRNTWMRWEAAGCPGDFLDFLGARYCPVTGDKSGLNKNWIKNVRARMPARKRDFSVK